MFEARLDQSDLWKKILEAVKDLINDANLECSAAGVQLQAMDNSHVALVTLLLRADVFSTYRCERNVTLGINLANMAKVLRCANKDDAITMRYEDGADTITFLLENSSQDKTSEFCMKLMNIEGDCLGIPDQMYKARVTMPSGDLTKVCRDMSTFGDCVQVAVTADAVKFSASGDFGTGSSTIKPTMTADCVKIEGKETKDSKVETTEDAKNVVLELSEPVTLNYSLKHLVSFTKAGGLADRVKLSMARDAPLAVEYKISAGGYIRFYLAPKVDDETEGAADS